MACAVGRLLCKACGRGLSAAQVRLLGRPLLGRLVGRALLGDEAEGLWWGLDAVTKSAMTSCLDW